MVRHYYMADEEECKVAIFRDNVDSPFFTIRCQKCGSKKWSVNGSPAFCMDCGGVMLNEDQMNYEVDQMRLELGLARPLREVNYDAL